MNHVDPFQPEKCKLCGECLHQCPVMRLPLETAKAEVAKLRKGELSGHALKKCTSCFSCNLICPEQCNPAQAILDLWHQKGLSDGFPIRARYFTPDHPLNFRTYVLERMPEDDRTLVMSWADDSPCETVFYPGCNVIIAPYLTRTKLLAGMNIRGGLDLCCGEMYYRTAQYEMLEKTAQRLTEWSRKLGFKKMIIPCTAGRNLFTNVLPKFGAQFDFEVEHLLSILLRRIENGEIKITRPLNLTVAIQESCHGKFFGDGYLDVPRRLLEKIGVTVREEELCRNRMICCGIAGGFSQPSGYHPWDITLAAIKALRQAKNTGAQALAVYCAGCLQMLGVGQIVYRTGMPIYHILELLQMAIGEEPQRRNKHYARLMFQGVAINQFPLVLSRKRFFPLKNGK